MIACLDYKGITRQRAIHTADMNISFDIYDNTVFHILLV